MEFLEIILIIGLVILLLWGIWKYITIPYHQKALLAIEMAKEYRFIVRELGVLENDFPNENTPEFIELVFFKMTFDPNNLKGVYDSIDYMYEIVMSKFDEIEGKERYFRKEDWDNVLAHKTSTVNIQMSVRYSRWSHGFGSSDAKI